MELMEPIHCFNENPKPIRKRLRSDESPCSATQTKMFINQRIVDQNDNNKMRQIQAKTMRNLFEGARKSFLNEKTAIVDLCEQIILHGDGRIEFRNNAVPMDLSVERRISNCCGGIKTFVQDVCSMCNFSLCEECGYSCSDCGRFLCRSCVSLFGCGTAENPICEKCALFN